MIEVCSAVDLAQNPTLYDEMLRLRYRVFHERLQWDVPVRNGFDFDQFDVCSPDYILAFDDRDVLVGCWRLLSTEGPYMLRDVFSKLLEGAEPPKAKNVWESSRFAVDCGPDAQSGGLNAVGRYSAELFLGLVECAHERGIEEILTVYDIRIARLLNRLGAKAHWTSGKHQVGNTTALAGRFYTDHAMLMAIREATGIHESVIRPYRGTPHRIAA